MSLIDAEKELHMARRIVKFAVTDGRKPSKTEEVGKPFALKMPVPLRMAARTTRTVTLGVSCNLPSIVVCRGKAEVFPPGAVIKVDFATAEDALDIGEGETVAKLFPIDSTYLEIGE